MTGGKPAVLVVTEGKVHRREIELGLTEGGRVQGIGGRSGDEQVVADGKSLLREDQAVEGVP